MNAPASIRDRIIEAIVGRRSGHLCASLSSVELLFAVFRGSWDVDTRTLLDTDLVLSKGHAAPALYAVLDHFDVDSEFDASRFRRLGSPYEGHPRKGMVPTCVVSTGSLGLGIAFAVGRAIAHDRLGSGRGMTVVMSDGELQTGIAYEALSLLAGECPANTIVMVDTNKWQTSGPIRHPRARKEFFEALGLNAVEIDGHDVDAVADGLLRRGREPVVLIAHTKRCKGLLGYEDGAEIYGETMPADIRLAVASDSADGVAGGENG